ncbi:VPS35 endosomal protein sorting factor-like [Nasonia vitripennis]|uniref:VPS35 endosomal protein sorting factor-like n=1 Tax=Nasonia vitripennis TaxID=7425 RepID=A0A7M7GEV2_NASVI|nr:VPS35 endosomal protein sorting factor-like [Nasonia vitripennis]
MTDYEWFARPVDYEARRPVNLEEANDHPLKPVTVTVMDGRSAIRRGTLRSTTSTSSSTRTPTPTQTTVPVNIGSIADPLSSHSSLDGSDPLTQFVREEMDPLSKMASDEWDYSANANAVGRKAKDKLDEIVEPWAARKALVLNKYTTLEKLSIVTSFLPGGEKVIMKVQPSGSLVDKVKTRLEQLDDFEDGSVRQMHGLSQQEYMARIEQLNNELVNAWHSDHRVKALKIAIQCAKLLVDTSVISFYPSKYVLVTDILDIFGKLVYERLKVKAEYIKPGSKTPTSLPDNFTPDMVPENAKETCQNWFYKIASIRELVPRLYVEMAIIKSYSFLTTSEFSTILMRLTRMIRGIGDPLVAVYARCYLCRVGFALKTSDLDFVKENFYDFLYAYKQLFSTSVKGDLLKQNLCLHSYLNLYTPALDWILQVMAATASENLLNEVLLRCKQQPNSALLLNTILTSFKPIYIVSRAMEFVNLIETCQDNGYPQYLLYRSLGECLIKESPPKEDCQHILNTVWKYMKGLNNYTRFMHVMEVWIQFTCIHFSASEINLFLGEIINQLGPSRAFEHFYPQLQNIAEKIVANTQDFDSLLTMDNFLPLIDLFQKESIKVEVCKTVVEGLSKQSSPIVDPIMINALMFIMRIMHDSVSALTVEDEKRQIGQLICGLILRVDYGRDFEKQLNFYVEARAAFHNLDSVHMQLVQCVNRLSVDTRKIVRGHHTRRTSAFVRACAAFCFITIPSLTLVHTRLQLYLLSGQVALLNQCYGQADSCFKAALSLVPEMPKNFDIDGRSKSTEPYLLTYLSNFLSTLLVVPDSPEHGVLYLMRGLLNVVQRYFVEDTATKSHLYLRVLDLLSTVTQETYPYHVDKVDSNDKLYGSDQKFIIEVNKICSKVMEELLNHLKNLGEADQLKKQSALALALFERMILRADLTDSSLSHVAVNLWNLSQKHDTVNSKLRLTTLEYMVRKSHLPQFQHFAEMLKKMSK